MDADGGEATGAPSGSDIARRAPPSLAGERAAALLEVLLCSDYPTQWIIGLTLVRMGVGAQAPDGSLTLSYVATLSLIDSVVLVGLIWIFLASRRERLWDLVVGQRSIAREALRGVPLIVAAFGIAILVLGLVQLTAPQLHTVPNNPLQALMKTPLDTAIFLVVVVVAGGVREEIQRAFLLHRFEQWLGGATVGLVITSVVFGAGHAPQGLDAILATAMLGAFWALVYLRRRSAISTIVSHAGFNVVQLVQFVIVSRR